MTDKHKKNLELFRALTGKSVVNAPKQSVPTTGYWQAGVKVFWK